MKVLVICIEVLIGHYFINIYSDYIITYRVDDNSSKKLDINIINMNSELMYFLDNKSNDISKISNIVYDNSNSSIVLLESKVIESKANYKTFNCEVNLIKYIYNDSILIYLEEYYSDIPLINNYIKLEKFKQKLPYIGSSYMKLKKYLLKSEDVTHSEPMLISKLIFLKEQNHLDEDLLMFLKDINDY